ncbi:MAG: hypothetical protein LAP61_02975 [Acidobacteriia bacterium]|nr:hypothetical protein [Terriglobia bacterium]
MRSITPAQAALFAALAMVLLTGFSLVDNAALLNDAPGLVLLGNAVPNAVWAGFFFAVYKCVYRSPTSVRNVAWITLVFAVILEAAVVCIRYQHSVSYWTPLGNALSLSGWLLRLGWTVFLISFALAPEHVADSRTRKIALVLAIVSAPSALSAAFDAWNSWIGFLFDDIPKQAFWRVLITPVIRTVYWVSQILFLWSVWGNPEARKSVEEPSARFAP